ncbi:MAG: amidinotransferase [Segetibacter sp.]|nr:amidinotransferase [Segetibacter sp.]
MSITNKLLMIRPVNFCYNEQTAVNNAFQVYNDQTGVQQKAEKEFDDFVNLLTAKGVDVTVVNDTAQPCTPDSIFPNNWISSHEDGSLCLYPMFAPNRRLERKLHVIEALKNKFSVGHTVDFSSYENEHVFLEGTGSMVLDREQKIAYACISPRTNVKLLNEFCAKLKYTPVTFHAFDSTRCLIYHTNVMMCVADKYVVICLTSIHDEAEKNSVADSIKQSGKSIIEITEDQMNHFAGNMLQVQNNNGEKFLVMSSQAFHSLRHDQLISLTAYNEILHSKLATIETNGGGSARCMMAEIYFNTKV